MKKPTHAPLAIASPEVEAISDFGESAKLGRHRSLATVEVFLAIDLAVQTVVHQKVLTGIGHDGSLASVYDQIENITRSQLLRISP